MKIILKNIGSAIALAPGISLSATARSLILFALVVSAANISWGAVANCGNAAAFPTQPQTVADLQSSNQNGTGNGPGCVQVDKTFSNFSEGAFTCTGTGGGCPTSDPLVTGTYTTFSGTLASQVGVQFGTTRGADVTNNWSLTSNGTVAFSSSYIFSVNSVSGLSLARLLINLGTLTGGAGNQWAATLNLCPGTVTFSAGCSGELTNTLTALTANQNTTMAGTIALANGTKLLGAQIVLIGNRTAGNTVNLNWAEADFGAPEPSSYALLGSGLVFFGYIGYRRRRASAFR